jgi:CheY-like chemotaxis protein
VLPLEPAIAETRPAPPTVAHPPTPTVVEAKPDECPLHTRRTLLFADDLPLNRFLVRRFVKLEFPLVDVLEACDGEQAVAMFEAQAPDLVLLDLHMPTLDGWQAAAAIRRRPRGLDVPIVALSVDASPTAESNAVRAGFQEFIAKPISDYSALKARLTYWLGPRDARGKAITVAPSPSCEQCLRRPMRPGPRSARVAGHGGVAERLKAPVLKTGRARALVGSNPTPSALFLMGTPFGVAAIGATSLRFAPPCPTGRAPERAHPPR